MHYKYKFAYMSPTRASQRYHITSTKDDKIDQINWLENLFSDDWKPWIQRGYVHRKIDWILSANIGIISYIIIKRICLPVTMFFNFHQILAENNIFLSRILCAYVILTVNVS